MKRVLILGAGLVSLPIVKYLTGLNGYAVTVVSKDPNAEMDALLKGFESGSFLVFDTSAEEDRLDRLIKDNDVVVSLLPYVLHPQIARKCIAALTDMITASYVSDEMKSLHDAATEKGILILNELGLDPGIDHMSAMKIIDDIHEKGGKIRSFESFCGGLPAPDANDNPLGYKFSWSPEGVVRASRNSAKFLKDGKVIEVPGEKLFKADFEVEVPGAGKFEAYPNRDSVPYRAIYGIEEAETVFRGTLRNKGWCAAWYDFLSMNLAAEDITLPSDCKSYCQLVKQVCNVEASGEDSLKKVISEKYGISVDSKTIIALSWLGYFSDTPLPSGKTTPFQVMVHTLSSKMEYKESERDMIVLFHRFVCELADGKVQDVTSTMVDYGIAGGDSAMARTVSLPVAIGARMVCEGQISLKGVQIPVAKEVYIPILDELENLGIKCIEEYK